MPDDRLFHPCLGHSAKVRLLSDFEELIWRDYILVADDFGVMQFTTIVLQAHFDRLASKPSRVIMRALARIAEVDLIRTFVHQGLTYCYQFDWQDWQHIVFPRRTAQPLPINSQLEACSRHTRWLFTMHPDGGRLDGWRAPKTFMPITPIQEDSRSSPEVIQEDSRSSPDYARRAHVAALAVSRLPLAVSHKPLAKEPPLIPPPGGELTNRYALFMQAYPAERRMGGDKAKKAFAKAMKGRVNGFFEHMLAALEQHKRSKQWAIDGVIPGLTVWLNQERWNQVLPEPTPFSSKGKTSDNAAALQRFADKRPT